MLIAVTYTLVNLLVDMAYLVIDPRTVSPVVSNATAEVALPRGPVIAGELSPRAQALRVAAAPRTAGRGRSWWRSTC